jgi:hypothetical protein
MHTSRFIKNITTAAFAGVLAALSGCASGPTFVSAEPAPADRAQIYIYRQVGFYGAVRTHDVVLSGQTDVFVVPNGSWKRVAVTPGTHALSIACAPKPLALELRAGETVFVEDTIVVQAFVGGTSISCDAVVRPQDRALKEMAGLKGA